MDRRQLYVQRIGRDNPERRKQLFDRRQHHGIFRIFFTPWNRLFNEFSDVKLFSSPRAKSS